MTPTEARQAHAKWAERPFARAATLLAGAIVISALGGWARSTRGHDDLLLAEATVPPATVTGDSAAEALRLARTELAQARAQLDRASALIHFSSRYQIPADLAATIYDVAVSEGINPALGFRLVDVESQFKPTARSAADAIGLAQVRLATARAVEPGMTEAQLYDPETNLRIGFRFLRQLLDRFDGDMRLALLAYNRGPARVDQLLAQGEDPSNGYQHAVLRGYRPVQVPAGAPVAAQ